MLWPHTKTPIVLNKHRIQNTGNRGQNTENRIQKTEKSDIRFLTSDIWHLTSCFVPAQDNSFDLASPPSLTSPIRSP